MHSWLRVHLTMHRTFPPLVTPLLAFVCIVLTSCFPPRATHHVPPCPPPPPPSPCAPETYTGVTYDTSRVMNGVKWSIRRVANADGSSHEWALFTGGTDLLLKGRKAGEWTYLPVRRTQADRIEQHAASDIIARQSLVATTVAAGSIMGDADLVRLEVDNNSVRVVDDTSIAALNMPVHWDGHPTVSTDGTVLVFASERPGGMGGTDLWYSIRTASSWSTPRLVGGPVNSPCDELTPMFAGDSVIVFASAGHASVGGYDLFAADVERSGDAFSLGRPRNLGRPVNTPYDEIFPVWAASNTLYYGSDQPRTADGDRKDFDVFVLTSLRPTTPKPPTTEKPVVSKETKKATVTGTVVNQQTKTPVRDADVTAREAETQKVVAATTTDTTGTYTMDVPVGVPIDVSAQAPDLFFEERRITVDTSRANDTVRIERPMEIPVVFLLRVNFPTAIYDAPYAMTLDSNGMETKQSWQEALESLARNVKLSGKKLKKLVLIGHTDDVDTDESNLILGRNRVRFIMDELARRGVPQDVMEGRSAGETMLPDRRAGESIDLWRKRARRVELVKVLQN
jgi:outer membrane protein OmpA-like peptidoglycan-associated protein